RGGQGSAKRQKPAARRGRRPGRALSAAALLPPPPVRRRIISRDGRRLRRAGPLFTFGRFANFRKWAARRGSGGGRRAKGGNWPGFTRPVRAAPAVMRA